MKGEGAGGEGRGQSLTALRLAKALSLRPSLFRCRYKGFVDSTSVLDPRSPLLLVDNRADGEKGVETGKGEKEGVGGERRK